MGLGARRTSSRRQTVASTWRRPSCRARPPDLPGLERGAARGGGVRPPSRAGRDAELRGRGLGTRDHLRRADWLSRDRARGGAVGGDRSALDDQLAASPASRAAPDLATSCAPARRPRRCAPGLARRCGADLEEQQAKVSRTVLRRASSSRRDDLPRRRCTPAGAPADAAPTTAAAPAFFLCFTRIVLAVDDRNLARVHSAAHRDPARRVRRLRLLQPLVALRLDPGHVAGLPGRYGRVPVCDLVLYAFPPAHTSHLPKRIVALDYLLLLAFVAGTRLLARTLLERPRAAARRARQGGAGRRRRRRRPADPARDAAQPAARVHADRARRRRPAQEEPSDPRRPRARHDRRTRAA